MSASILMFNMYRRETRFGELKKLWRLRYRVYAIIVLLLSVFIFNSDTATAVKVVIPEDSLNYRVVASNLLTSQVELQTISDNFNSLDSILYRDTNRYLIAGDKQLLTDNLTIHKVDKLGFTYAKPQLVLNPGSFVPEETKLSLNDIIPAPVATKVERKNFLEYPRFSIKTPIVQTTPTDLYNTKSDGTVDFQNPIIEDPIAYAGGNYESTPVLRKLLDGAVLLNGVPFIPEPGELGNAYIVGHGRNYANTGSPYAQIFEPLLERSEVGDEINIWDADGRKLIFKVFQNDLINFDDVEGAYGWTSGIWNNRRIVTLQTCKLEWTASTGWYPTKRWLVRAELQITK